MLYEFGDVVLLPFPFTDQSNVKKRPAVIVSSNRYNAAMPDIVVMAITSQMHANRAVHEVWLTDWASAGLVKPSAVKPIMATIERLLVLKKMGALTGADLGSLRALIGRMIG